MEIKINAVHIHIQTDTAGISKQLSNLELKMATVQEIIEAARAEQDAVVATITSTHALITEIRQLLAQNDIAGAQALLDDIQANTEALIAANIENTAVAAAVDAVNGDPAPVVTDAVVTDTAA